MHLHSTNAAAVSCLPPWRPNSALPPLTPYFIMRVGQTPLIPYRAPGDPAQADYLRKMTIQFRAALLQSHGPITAGTELTAAVDAAIELEEVCKLHLLVGQRDPALLSPEQIRELTTKFGTHWDV